MKADKLGRGFGGLESLKDLAENSKVLDKGLGYLLLPIEDVESKAQVRQRFTGIEELAETIRQDQLQSPIHVAPKNDDGKYVILRGERRWRACKHLGMKEIKAIIDDTSYTGGNMLIGEMVENVQRSDLDPIELAQGMYRLVNEFGLKPTEVAQRLGKSRGYVSMHLAIADSLPDYVDELIKDGLAMGVETLYILGQLNKADSGVAERLCAAARAEGRGVTRGEARDALKAVTEPAEASAAASEVTETQGRADQQANDGEMSAPAPTEGAADEKCSAGEKFDESQDQPASVDTDDSDSFKRPNSPAAQQKPAKKASPVAIDLLVSVLVDDHFQKGTIAWGRKTPRDGYVFVTLEDGSARSFALSEVELLDVRNVEEDEIAG